jgi:hypothetical protein
LAEFAEERPGAGQAATATFLAHELKQVLKDLLEERFARFRLAG